MERMGALLFEGLQVLCVFFFFFFLLLKVLKENSCKR
jgi:hypothetical protein